MVEGIPGANASQDLKTILGVKGHDNGVLGRVRAFSQRKIFVERCDWVSVPWFVGYIVTEGDSDMVSSQISIRGD